jgi:hypothetical protein|nr:MAG TPA: hypothetical protein [Caudoviricetes sp.]
MNTIILALASLFSLLPPKTEKFWIGGCVYELPYEDGILTINGDFDIRCQLIENDSLTDEGSDIFIDRYDNLFHLAWTDYGIAIVPLSRKYVKWQVINQ